MNTEIFQRIFDLIQPGLPQGWKKMIMYIAYTEGSYSMKYYTCNDEGSYIDCFKQGNMTKSQLIMLFMNVDKVLVLERKKLGGKDKWSVMTMVVSANGEMRTDFDYADISENAIAYEKEWAEKYLKP